jgi:hypothetical protein
MSALSDLFSHVGWTPVASAEAERALSELEQRIGQRLPGMFRELMALENGPSFLAHFSNADIPVPPNELAASRDRWPAYDPLGEKRLPFMIDNQGVCVWAISLDEGDDPPVVVEVDSGTPPRWQRHADKFSIWLACQVHDRRLLFEAGGFRAQAAPLNEQVLSALRQHFDEGPQTFAWPGTTNYRFSNARCGLLLWANDRQCDWNVVPKSAELEPAGLDEIHAIAEVGKDLYALNDEGNLRLRAWRAAKGL